MRMINKSHFCLYFGKSSCTEGCLGNIKEVGNIRRLRTIIYFDA